MEISKTLTGRMQPLPATAIPALRLQQSVAVQVLQIDATKNSLLVALGNQALVLQSQQKFDANRFTASTTLPLIVSQVAPTLELQTLAKVGHDSITFTTRSQSAQANKSEPTDAAVIDNVLSKELRQRLAQQLPLSDLFSQLSNALPKLQAAEQQLPTALNNLLSLVLLQLPKSAQLTDPERLQQMIVDSGLWLEAKLVQNKALKPTSDLKANLLKLLQALDQPALAAEGIAKNLQQELSELQTQVKGSLSSLTLNQLQSLPQSEQQQIWHLTLPFQHADAIQQLAIQIERERQHTQTESHDDVWSVTLSLNPSGLANINCKITYVEQQVNIYFKSDSESTAAIIKQQSELLKSQLIAAGLKIGYLDAQVGPPAEPHINTLPIKHLFDDQA